MDEGLNGGKCMRQSDVSNDRGGIYGAIWLLLIVYVWTLPVGGTAALRNVAMLSMLGLTAFAVWQRSLVAYFPVRNAWLAYLAVAASTLAYALDRSYSLQEIRVEILYPAIVFFVAATVIRTPQDWMRLATALLCGSAILAAYSDFTGMTGGTTKDGLVGSLNSGVGSYSTYVVTSLPVIVALGWHEWGMGKRRLIFVLALAVLANLGALYFTQNRQSFVALFAEVIVITCIVLARGFTIKRAGLSALLLLVLASLFVFQYVHRVLLAPGASVSTAIHEKTKQDVRWPVWKRVVTDVAQDPLVGAGFGLRTFTLKYEGKVQFDGPFWHAHNMLLNKAVQMGVPGVIAFLALFWAMPWRVRNGLNLGRSEKIIALTGIALASGVFIKNMTDDFFTRDGALLYWLLAGATLGSLRHCVREKAQ